METIDIFFTIDDKYSKYLAVSILSIVVNTDSYVHFHVIDGGISIENKRKLSQMQRIRKFEIEYLPVDREVFAQLPPSSQKHISNATNHRFLVATLKPELDKCLFLDADLVACGDIAKLWATDIKDYYMAAVTDQYPLNPKSWTKKFPLPERYVYVNTGVTVLNLEKWRQDQIEEKLFENVEKYKNLLRFPDQDTLNITLAPQVKYISHVFNAMPVQKYFNKQQEIEAFSAPIILHWAGYEKPWKYPRAAYSEFFWNYARMTPFYDEIIYSNMEMNILDEIRKLFPNTPPSPQFENKYREEATQLRKMMRKIAQLTIYRRKLRRIRWKSFLSWGKRKRRYLKRKEQLKKEIRDIENFLQNE